MGFGVGFCGRVLDRRGVLASRIGKRYSLNSFSSCVPLGLGYGALLEC